MIGKSLKQYVIEEKLGQGGMGVVYRARDTRLDRPVAIKVLPPDLVRDEDRRRRFIQEARAASAVNHPAIAQIYEIEEEGDLTYIVMEHVDGSTVRELVSRRELDIASALEVGIQVGDALARAHDAGILHRDVKSENIMVSRDGHPKILDFGLAKLLEATSAGDGVTQMETLARTQAGVIVGTLLYMSPERARGLPADRRSEIFSFGVVLYEMSTGRLPFQGPGPLETMHAIVYEQPQPVTSVNVQLPYSLHRVVDRCIRKKPEERYQEMRQVVEDLRGVKRAIETGVSGGVPVVDRVRGWVDDMRARGVLWPFLAGAGTGGLLVFLIMGGSGISVASLIVFAVIGALVYRSIRNRGLKQARRFAARASGLKEVSLVSFHKGHFTVVVEEPTAKTYLKLNAYLSTANEKLFHGEPMTMAVRDDVDDAEMKHLLASPGVYYVRDDSRRARRK
jgi:tRNA A-37 threonylcarbamoyl transferase component Bud32